MSHLFRPRWAIAVMYLCKSGLRLNVFRILCRMSGLNCNNNERLYRAVAEKWGGFRWRDFKECFHIIDARDITCVIIIS